MSFFYDFRYLPMNKKYEMITKEVEEYKTMMKTLKSQHELDKLKSGAEISMKTELQAWIENEQALLTRYKTDHVQTLNGKITTQSLAR